MTTTLRDATMKLVEGVLALLNTPCENPLYCHTSLAVVALCKMALDASVAARAAEPPVAAVREDLGPRIAELAANGEGVRAIARILGVNASTVSRRLRRADLG